MDKPAFTPGPWTALDGSVWTALHDPVETTYDIGTPIADVRRLKSFAGPAYSDQEVAANARLIAAAPRMFEGLVVTCGLLTELSETLGPLGKEGLQSYVAKLQTIINQAEGRA